MREVKRPKTALKTVRQAYDLVSWVTDTKNSNDLLQPLKALGHVHPEVLEESLYAFRQQGGDDLSSFIAQQQLTHKMFAAAAPVIAKYISICSYAGAVDEALPYMRSARAAWKAANTDIDVEEADFEERRSQLQLALRAAGVKKELSKIKGIETRLERYDEYPDHPEFTPKAAAAAIADFLATRSNSALRLNRVKAELKRWATAYRGDSDLTSEYVAGEDMDVEEVRHLFNLHILVLHTHVMRSHAVSKSNSACM
eukprot:7290-Heterococcus_DN1.PRE.2